jgi:hypothetical protein
MAFGKTVNTGVAGFLAVAALLIFGVVGYVFFNVAFLTADKLDHAKTWNAPRSPPAAPSAPPPPPNAPTTRRLSERFRAPLHAHGSVSAEAERVLVEERRARR